MTSIPEFELTTIRGDEPGPKTLILAGVHGDEFEPMVAVRRLTKILCRQSIRGEVTLAPILNQSAWQQKRRTGSDGLDLARTFPGRIDGSVTERVAWAADQLIRRADYLIDMHTGGTQLRLWPLSGFLLHADLEVLERQRAMARAFNLPVVWGTDPTLNGRTLSSARDANVPAIYVEYLGAAPFCREAVHALVSGCLQTMTMLGMLEGELPASQVRYWAEDDRLGAGHLQVCHPAPHGGSFEALVDLGQLVDAGQQLGWLIEPPTSQRTASQRTAIVAGNSGRVVCLAGPRPVPTGYGLAVVAEFASV